MVTVQKSTFVSYLTTCLSIGKTALRALHPLTDCFGLLFGLFKSFLHRQKCYAHKTCFFSMTYAKMGR